MCIRDRTSCGQVVTTHTNLTTDRSTATAHDVCIILSQKSTCREKKTLCVRIHLDPFSLRAGWTSTPVVLQYRCNSAQGNLMWTGRNNTHKPDNRQIYSNSARRMHHTTTHTRYGVVLSQPLICGRNNKLCQRLRRYIIRGTFRNTSACRTSSGKKSWSTYVQRAINLPIVRINTPSFCYLQRDQQ